MQNSKNEVLQFLKNLKPELTAQGIISLGLFGSIAKGTNTDKSDIDIAFMSETVVSNVERWEIQEKLASRLNINIDLLDLRRSDDVVSFEVLSKGKNIFKKESNNLEVFLDNIYINYIQLNEDRQEIIERYA